MYSNAKANALIRDLADLLSKRLTSSGGLNTLVQGFYTDANGAVWPNLTISNNGTLSEGSQVVLIQLANVDAVSKDIFGNQTNAYAPHLMQIAYELGASSNITIVSHADLMAVLFEAIKVGARTQVVEIANGNAVTSANISAHGTVAADLDQLYWPTKLV